MQPSLTPPRRQNSAETGRKRQQATTSSAIISSPSLDFLAEMDLYYKSGASNEKGKKNLVNDRHR
jgi:hypothetical protein